jgi:hypothetical protein
MRTSQPKHTILVSQSAGPMGPNPIKFYLWSSGPVYEQNLNLKALNQLVGFLRESSTCSESKVILCWLSEEFYKSSCSFCELPCC